MMKTQRTGTLSPKMDAGGTMRRGVLALVVLLLACTLMAGAVSAVDKTEFNQTSFQDGTYTINGAGTYVLNETAVGHIKITASNVDVILNSTSGVKLTGNITISNSANVTIDGMDITVNSSMQYDTNRVSAIRVTATTPGCIVLKNSNITFDKSVDGKKGYVIVSGFALAGSEVTNNKFSNVPGHVLSIHGLQDGKSMTVSGNTVTMNPDEDIRPEPDAQGTGRALLKVWHGYTLNSGVTYIVKDNVVSVVNGNNNKTNVVRVDKATTNPDKVTVKMTNNSLDGDTCSPYLYGGSIYGYQLGTLYINESATSNVQILAPGLNQTGVVWSGDVSATEQTLELNESGSYKLMKDFTSAGIKITGEGVTLNGDKKQITVKLPTDATEKHRTAIDVTGKNADLKNLNLAADSFTGSSDTDMTYLNAVYAHSSEEGTFSLSDSTLDMSKATSSQQTMVVHVVGTYSTVTLKENTITGAKSTNDDQTKPVGNHGTSFGIAVETATISDKLTIQGNTIYPGTAGNSGSIGMRTYALKQAPEHGILITENTIDFQHADGGKYFSGIHMDQIDQQSTALKYNITNNTITNLKAGSETDPEKSNKNSGIYLRNADNSGVSIALNMNGNTISGDLGDGLNVTAFYAHNVTFADSTIYNNTFKITGMDVAKYVRLTNVTTGDKIKWNSTGADKAHAGNWWGKWSEDRKSTTGYLTFANADAAIAAGLPVADLAPLVEVGQPAAQTIEITGNLSIENKTGNTETLTAAFTGGVAADFTWTVGTSGIIELTPTTGSSVTYKPLKIGTTNLTVTSGDVSKVVIITVYNTTAPEVDTTVTTEGNKVNISTSTGSGTTTITTSEDNTTATLTTESGVSITLTYEDAEGAEVKKDDNGNVLSVNGTIKTMVAEYPKSQAPVSADMPVPAQYALNITLDASNALKDGAAIVLPTINPAINQTIVEKITQKNSNHKPLAMISASVPGGDIAQINNNITKIELKFIIPKDGKSSLGKVKALHIKDDTITEAVIRVEQTTTEWVITIHGSGFSYYAIVEDITPAPGPGPQPHVSSSGSGNMDGAYRVLFNDGSSTLSVKTGLSAGDKITAPVNPAKDGYTFGGWYKDSACTQGWSFSEGIPGDMTLYAKWIPSSGGQSSSSQQTVSQTGSATAQQTVKATPAATQAQSTSAATPAASGTSASGVSPTMTQAPAPVFGALLGLLAAGVLLRRRD